MRTTRIGAALDRALEASVIGSFTRLGIGMRRRSQRWDPLLGAGVGRHVLVTGANRGLGLATAFALLVRGATVTISARDAERATLARDGLVASVSSTLGVAAADVATRVHAVTLDLEDLASVRRAADDLAALPPLDVVVHNAGAMFAQRRETADGLERTYQVHLVGPFLLTTLLVPQLSRRDDARVILVSSGGMYTERLVVRRLDSPGGYRPSVAYARAKRGQVELTVELHRRLGAATGIAFHAMHPGWARTPGLTASLPWFARIVGPLLRSPAQGADTTVHLALADRAATPGGAFWHDRQPRTTVRLRRTACEPVEREALWERLMIDAGIDRPSLR
jgi:NAD(P)-dependent dehydrogenase (short-subunit alcohol dehydrogenase family)